MIFEFLKSWTFVISLILAIISLIWSICNSIIGKLIAHKIQNNEIKHITADIDKLEKEEKVFKKEIRENFKTICDTTKRIETNQKIRDAICETRHGKN